MWGGLYVIINPVSCGWDKGRWKDEHDGTFSPAPQSWRPWSRMSPPANSPAAPSSQPLSLFCSQHWATLLMSSRRDQTKGRVSSRQTRHDLCSSPAPPSASSFIIPSCLLSRLLHFFTTVSLLPSYFSFSFSDTVLCCPVTAYCGKLKLKLKHISLMPDPHLFLLFEFSLLLFLGCVLPLLRTAFLLCCVRVGGRNHGCQQNGIVHQQHWYGFVCNTTHWQRLHTPGQPAVQH